MISRIVFLEHARCSWDLSVDCYTFQDSIDIKYVYFYNASLQCHRELGPEIRFPTACHSPFKLDCKTVGIFAYSSTRARKTLTPRFTDFFTDFVKKKTDRFAVYFN